MDLPICLSLGVQVPLALQDVAILCGILPDAHVTLDSVVRVLAYDLVPTQCETVCVDTHQVYHQIKTHVF